MDVITVFFSQTQDFLDSSIPSKRPHPLVFSMSWSSNILTIRQGEVCKGSHIMGSADM